MAALSNQLKSYKFGRFHLWPAESLLLCDHRRVHLPPLVFNTLVVLIEHHGHLLDKETLRSWIWPDTIVEEASLARNIADLRKAFVRALGEGPDEHEYIETVPKRGYRFIKPVEEMVDVAPPRVIDDVPVSPTPADAPPTDAPPTIDGPSPDAARPAENKASTIDTKIIIAIFVIGVSLMVLPYVTGIPKRDGMLIIALKICASALQFFVILWAFISTQSGPQRLGTIKKEEEDKVRRDSRYDEKDWEPAKDMAVTALKDYKKYWYGLLASWYLLYFVLAILWRWDPLDNLPISGAELTAKVFATLFNNCNSLMLALGYIILNNIPVIKKGDRHISDVPWLLGLVLVFAVAGVQFVAALLSPPERSGTINRAIVLEAFDWMSGIVGASALALYVGRLQSKFLGPPHKLLIALYSYTAIQPLYALLGRDKVAAMLIMYAALVLKILLCFYIVQLFREGRLLFYFVRVRRMYVDVPSEWQDFRKLIK